MMERRYVVSVVDIFSAWVNFLDLRLCVFGVRKMTVVQVMRDLNTG